jgi:hypothetical protein
MAKIKSKVEAPKLESFEEMEAAFSDHAAAFLAREELMVRLDQQLTVLRESFNMTWGAKLEAYNGIIAVTEKELHDWARRHPERFESKRSLETKFGTLQFFKGQHSARPKSKWNWIKVMARIHVCGLAKAFIRTIEEPNKEALIA